MKDNHERAVRIAARVSRERRQKKLQRDDSLLAEALQSKKFHSHKPEILCYHRELRSQITMACIGRQVKPVDQISWVIFSLLVHALKGPLYLQ